MAEEYPQIMKIFTHHNVRRWYVLTLPASHRGGARGLQQELESRIRNNEPLFEYFAPTYVTGRNVNGRDVEVCRPAVQLRVRSHVGTGNQTVQTTTSAI